MEEVPPPAVEAPSPEPTETETAAAVDEGKVLKISLEDGVIQIPGLPDPDADEAEKNDAALTAVDAVSQELAEAEALASGAPREALKQLWVLEQRLTAFPAKWIKNFQLRHGWNDASKRIEEARLAAFRELPDGEGQEIWDELAYIQQALPLLFERFKVRGDVLRLILTPLGKLKHSEIRYQRDDADDLPRVCQEVRDEIRSTAELDDELAVWGEENYGAMLEPGARPLSYPPGKIPPGWPGYLALLVGLGLAGGGYSMLAEGGATGPALLGVGGLALLFGIYQVIVVTSARAKAPQEFIELADQFRERLYLVCSLRVLDKLNARYNLSEQNFNSFLSDNGGRTRWKKTKFENRDLTMIYAEDAAEWHPKETIEHWLGERVKQRYRLESSKLTDPGELDQEAWEVILRAYLLENLREVVDAELLDTVAELIFHRLGEDVSEERERVFDRVYREWEQFVSERS